jgi:hypothetical protein
MEEPGLAMQRIGAIGGSIAPRGRSAVRRNNLASVECVQPTRIDSGHYDGPVCDEVFSFDSSSRSRAAFATVCIRVLRLAKSDSGTSFATLAALSAAFLVAIPQQGRQTVPPGQAPDGLG